MPPFSDIGKALRAAPGVDPRPARVRLLDGSEHEVNPLHPISSLGDEVYLLDGSSAATSVVTHVMAGNGARLFGSAGKAAAVAPRTTRQGHVTIEWNGDELLERLRRDTANAINAVTKSAVLDARATHVWVNRRDNLETKIKARRASWRSGAVITGAFGYAYAKGRKGVRDGFYGLFHEEGTVHEMARPTIRPAADRHFPDLLPEIRKRFRTRGVEL